MKKQHKKTIFTLCTFLALNLISYAQNKLGKSDDMGRITISTFVSDQVENFPPAAMGLLENKLNQIITQSGIGGVYSRFIITPNVSILSKDITASAPPMTALTAEITFYIGDGFDGKKFVSQSISLKGVDVNETKAYISAIKNINPNDPTIQAFIEKGKQKIIEYYNTQCDFIIKEAKMLESQNKFEEAIYKLTAVPDICADCFNKSMEAIGPIYKKQIDRDCMMKLTEATNLWNANQDINSANAAGVILSNIDPQASCFNEIKALFEKIAKRVVEVDKREWDFKLQIEKERVKAYRDVGVAWGNGQPKSMTYNVRGWW